MKLLLFYAGDMPGMNEDNKCAALEYTFCAGMLSLKYICESDTMFYFILSCLEIVSRFKVIFKSYGTWL
jgi:hypothetical protein